MRLATIELMTPAGPIRRIAELVGDRLVDLQASYAAYLERVDPGCNAEVVAVRILA